MKREALEFAGPGSAGIAGVSSPTALRSREINPASSEARWVKLDGGSMPMRAWWDWLWDVPVGGPKATALLRLMAGSVFLWEGIIKFVFANQGIGRFTKLLTEMSDKTQFIVVTHNRRTMEVAPVLYGVTMQEPGVSKIVSVRWDEAQTNAA